MATLNPTKNDKITRQAINPKGRRVDILVSSEKEVRDYEKKGFKVLKKLEITGPVPIKTEKTPDENVYGTPEEYKQNAENSNYITCELCGKLCSSSEDLDNHSQEVHPETPEQPEEIESTEGEENNGENDESLIETEATDEETKEVSEEENIITDNVDNEEEFSCVSCDKKYKTLSGLEKHVTTKHQ